MAEVLQEQGGFLGLPRTRRADAAKSSMKIRPTPRTRSRTRQGPGSERAREGTAGRLKNPARSTFPRTSTLRISHFPDPRNRRTPAKPPPKTTAKKSLRRAGWQQRGDSPRRRSHSAAVSRREEGLPETWRITTASPLSSAKWCTWSGVAGTSRSRGPYNSPSATVTPSQMSAKSAVAERSTQAHRTGYVRLPRQTGVRGDASVEGGRDVVGPRGRASGLHVDVEEDLLHYETQSLV